MAKYGKNIVAKICEIVANENPTVDELCNRAGIHRSTYFDWVKAKPDFSDAIKKAKNDHNELLIVDARRSLVQLVRGYTYEEIKTTYGRNTAEGKPTVKEQVRVKKHVPPSATAIIFTLVNRDPDNWRNKQELNGKIDLETRLGALNDTQLNSLIDQVLNSQPNGNE